MYWLRQEKLRIKKEEGEEGRRWCVITDEGMKKCFPTISQARRYKRKLEFRRKENLNFE